MSATEIGDCDLSEKNLKKILFLTYRKLVEEQNMTPQEAVDRVNDIYFDGDPIMVWPQGRTHAEMRTAINEIIQDK